MPFTWRTDGRDKDAQGDFGKSDSGQLKIWARNGQGFNYIQLMSKKFPLLNLNLEFLDLAPCRFASINVFVLSLSDFVCISWQSSKQGLEVL